MPVRVGQEVQALPWGDRVASRVALRVDDRALARPLGGLPGDIADPHGPMAFSSGGDHVSHERDAYPYPQGDTDGRVQLEATPARVDPITRTSTRGGRCCVPWAPEA